MIKRIVLAGGVLALSACSSPGAPHSAALTAAASATPATATAANPVTILRQAGAVPDPGTVYGGHDVYGDRDASGSFPAGGRKLGAAETVTVYTSAARAGYTAEAARTRNMPDDGHAVILVPSELAVILVTSAMNWAATAPVWAPGAAQIAARVHGAVVRPG